ncbi:MAG: hypothetical protein SGI77_27920 [Pirellulaceae bacterium]|nr:hypothetical protein [Pirellulaceae bacterium]
MRHSKNIQILDSNSDVLRSTVNRRRGSVFATVLASCLSAVVSQPVMSQSYAPAVTSVLDDTAQYGYSTFETVARGTDPTYNALASGQGGVISRQLSDGQIQLGNTDEGTIISVSEGEDRVTGQVPAGDFISTNANQMFGSGYSNMQSEYVPSSHVGGGSSYSGYGSTGYGNSNPCCPENCHSFYVSYDSIYIKKKADQSFSLSQGRFLSDFDFDFSHRITIGQMFDCTDGVEAVFTGPLRWSRQRIDQNSAGGLNSILTTGFGYTPDQIDTFNGSNRHIQLEQIYMQSYELNRRWFAWDIMSTLIGIRGFNYNESYLFDTVDSDLSLGYLRTKTSNFLLGGQVGADIYKPFGQRLALGSSTRVGIFANFNKGETLLVNDASFLINTRTRDTDVAGMIEYKALARYRILPHVIVRAGYEAWILAGIATVSDQRYVPINPSTGLNYRASDIVFFHGATGGVEIQF